MEDIYKYGGFENVHTFNPPKSIYSTINYHLHEIVKRCAPL